MKSMLTVAVLLVAVGLSNGFLRCYECIDCGERIGDPVSCSREQDVCLKVILGQHIVKKCSEDDICEMGPVERAATRAWNNIVNLFNDVSQDAQYQYCCEDDYCNSAIKTLPSIFVLLLPLVLASFFKN